MDIYFQFSLILFVFLQCVEACPSHLATAESCWREMGFIGDTIESIRSMQVRQVLAQIISLGATLPLLPQ